MAVPGDLTAGSSRERATTLRFGDLSLSGVSRAGEETWFRVRPPGLALDVGRGPLDLVGVSNVFLSHGHLDHVSGLPLLLSQRVFQHLGPTRVFCPEPIAAPLVGLLRATSQLEGTELEAEIVPLTPGERVPLPGDFLLEAFATDHVVPSLGCHLWRRTRRLAPELRDLPEEEIARRRHRGEEVSETRDELAVTYCGDTGPGVLQSEPRLFEARVLILECTFLGDETRGRGERFGHLHLDHLVEYAKAFRNEAVVLHHLSARHEPGELRRSVERRAPELAERLRVLGDESPDSGKTEK